MPLRYREICAISLTNESLSLAKSRSLFRFGTLWPRG